MIPDMSIPPEFSIRGPHGTLPWIAIVDGAPMLMWARDREEVDRLVSSHHPRAATVRVFSVVTPNHHLGSARVVRLIEG